MPPIEILYIFLIGGVVNAIFAPWAMNMHLLDKPITVCRIIACFATGCCPGAGQIFAFISVLAVIAWYLDELCQLIHRQFLRIPGVKKFLSFEFKK